MIRTQIPQERTVGQTLTLTGPKAYGVVSFFFFVWEGGGAGGSFGLNIYSSTLGGFAIRYRI